MTRNGLETIMKFIQTLEFFCNVCSGFGGRVTVMSYDVRNFGKPLKI